MGRVGLHPSRLISRDCVSPTVAIRARSFPPQGLCSTVLNRSDLSSSKSTVEHALHIGFKLGRQPVNQNHYVCVNIYINETRSGNLELDERRNRRGRSTAESPMRSSPSRSSSIDSYWSVPPLLFYSFRSTLWLPFPSLIVRLGVWDGGLSLTWYISSWHFLFCDLRRSGFSWFTWAWMPNWAILMQLSQERGIMVAWFALSSCRFNKQLGQASGRGLTFLTIASSQLQRFRVLEYSWLCA